LVPARNVGSKGHSDSYAACASQVWLEFQPAAGTERQAVVPGELRHPESGIGLRAPGQLARHYGLPFRTGGGLNSSQTCDAQAAYESLMTLLPTFLAGTNF